MNLTRNLLACLVALSLAPACGTGDEAQYDEAQNDEAQYDEAQDGDELGTTTEDATKASKCKEPNYDYELFKHSKNAAKGKLAECKRLTKFNGKKCDVKQAWPVPGCKMSQGRCWSAHKKWEWGKKEEKAKNCGLAEVHYDGAYSEAEMATWDHQQGK